MTVEPAGDPSQPCAREPAGCTDRSAEVRASRRAQPAASPHGGFVRKSSPRTLPSKRQSAFKSHHRYWSRRIWKVMRAETESHRRRDQAVGRAAEEASLTSIARSARLAELNKLAEDPTLWNDPQRAQRLMQERTCARGSAHRDRPHRAGARRPAQHDRARRSREGPARSSPRPRRRLTKLKAEVARRELEALLSGEADANDSYLEVHAGAGGTESQDWANMLLRMYTRWAEQHGYKVEYLEETDGEEAGIKSATVQVKGHNAYGWLKTRERRASPGAHFAVRFQRAPPHLVRQRQRLSGDRRPHRHRHQGIRRAHRHHARAGRRRPARQQDRVGGAPDAYPDRHCGRLPGRPLAAQNRAQAWDMLRARLYEAELKKREAKAAAEQRRQDRYRLGPPDPLLRAAALPDGEGPAHRRVRPPTPAACSTAISTSSWRRRWRRRRSAADRMRSRTWSNYRRRSILKSPSILGYGRLPNAWSLRLRQVKNARMSAEVECRKRVNAAGLAEKADSAQRAPAAATLAEPAPPS